MKKIVIIEDNPVVARLYENKMLADGNTVSVASDGETGLEMIYNVKPDLLMIDLMLPNMSGVEVIKKVRADFRFYNVPIMAYSSADEDLLSQAVAAGSTTIISKNEASFKEIVEHLRNLLESTRNWQIYSPNAFESEVPKQDEEVAETPTAPGASRVLIVEDDPITAKIISSIVEKADLAPIIVGDGQEAYRMLTEEANFVAAVIDVELPGIRGIDLLKYMRTEKRLMYVPVIIMTAAEQFVRVQLDSHAAGAQFFVQKPFERQRFETIFQTLITTS